MIDFHSHFLPGIDDGSDCVETSLAMLHESYRQGVRLMFATPHFYADEDDPESFLLRRSHAYRELREAIAERQDTEIPEILLGAEILFFPGMSVAEELVELGMERTPFLLIEPPMMPWSNSMLDEIELTGENLRRIPVIAHVDRYMRMLRDSTLIDRLKGRRMLVQVNASFFLYDSQRALDYLRQNRIQFIGSDCHNMEQRAPNMGPAEEIIRLDGASDSFEAMNKRIFSLLGRQQQL
jgi:protein-tyrosine phosphatase